MYNAIKEWYTTTSKLLKENNKMPFISFVPQGKEHQKVVKQKRKTLHEGLLFDDTFTLLADLESSSESIQQILKELITEYKNEFIPDLIFVSKKNKKVIIGELTSPWEENISAAEKWKYKKYNVLIKKLETSHTVSMFSFSIGARGYVSRSLNDFLKDIGMKIHTRKKIARDLAEIAVFCSYSIYLHRNSDKWYNGQQSC